MVQQIRASCVECQLAWMILILWIEHENATQVRVEMNDTRHRPDVVRNISIHRVSG